jgi:tetratricopeptide (TPR) repeat protein
MSEESDSPLVADRFAIESIAGRGGMGVVHRAVDRVSGERVAVKVLGGMDGDPARFAREAQILAELDHPAIVRYVAHGATSDGRPFLAMEWLEGEDLGARLSGRGLEVAEALAAVKRVASGLAAAHARGIVHRDIKPSNVFLVGSDPERAKLLDFGIARVHFAPPANTLTHDGIVLGTIGYMAPEQALADEMVDARADVFSMGAVLFECLTGTPAFAAKQIVGVLAKLLREDAPRVRDLRPDLPPALDDLVARMLSRDRSARPRDAGELLDAIRSLGLLSGAAPRASPHAVLHLSDSEQRYVSAILAMGAGEEPERARDLARRMRGEMLRLADGTVVVLFESPSAPNEQAIRAAACALALRAAFPRARIALVTGRITGDRHESPAAVVDRGAPLLVMPCDDGVRVDALTATLLGNRFQVERRGNDILLRGAAVEDHTPRTLLGRATPCVGREKELALLEATWRECVDESVPRAVLVVGPPGQGKSRLAHEFVARLRQQEDGPRGGMRTIVARADAVGAGSTFLLVRQMLRSVLGLSDGHMADSIVRARVRALIGEASAARVADFLLELAGLPVSDPSAQLRSARNDPQIMASWLRQSFGDWLAAECAVEPMLLILEDLHWADFASVSYLGDALRASPARPFMILALARPEVFDLFPALWPGAEMQKIALGRLTPSAADKLVRAVTGPLVLPSETVGRIVRRADGNAFYLEELVRWVAEGGQEGLPETVLLVAQSRLHQLVSEDRRIVRAASVFGEVFWRRGVERLVGAKEDDPEVGESLRRLVASELFEPRRESRFSGHADYAFRHALLREAAYAMLTEEDRVRGHRLAGDWLERAGAEDPLMLAHHFELGQRPERALPWLLRAQQAAYDGGNVPAVVDLAARGARCGAAGEDLGALRLTEGMALTLQGAWTKVIAPCREAMALLPQGSTRWFLAASMAFVTGMFLGDLATTGALLFEILSVRVPPERSGPYGLAVFSTCIGLIGLGQPEMARQFIELVWRDDMNPENTDPAFVLRLQTTVGFLRIAEGDLGSALSRLTQATSLAERAGDAWGRASSATQYAAALSESGLVDRVEATARDNLAYCERTGLSLFSDWTNLHLARAWRNVGRLDEAAGLARSLIERPDPLLVASCRALLAEILVVTGRATEGVNQARRALDDGGAFPAVQAAAYGALAVAALRGGHPGEALAMADKGIDAAARCAWPRDHFTLRLARAESLHAAGRKDEARDAIAEARSRVARVAATFEDPEIRRAYETEIPETARILALAAEWTDGGRPEVTGSGRPAW